jgi:hypothetical protein
MATPICLCQVVLPDINGLPKDEIVNTFAFGAAVTNPIGPLTNFYIVQGASSANALSWWIGNSRSRVANACQIRLYQLTDHLHGEPHGSPLQVASFTLPAPRTPSNVPSQVAVSVFAVAGANPGVPGVAETVKSTEAAIDQGAPPTHGATSRPAARNRAHIQFGPLVAEAADPTGHVTSALVTDLAGACQDLLAAMPQWSVWSRMDGLLKPVTRGWVDRSFGTVRRRKEPSTGRLAWP